MNKRFQLTYNKGKRCGNETYTIAIPDSFAVEEGAEGRDFIAWLPVINITEEFDSDTVVDSEIVFFAGQSIEKSIQNIEEVSPEDIASFAENMLKMIYGSVSDTYIPISSGYPAGCLSLLYDNNCCHYNIALLFKSCIKMMRVQISNVNENDIDDCNRMVTEWIKTIRLTQEFKPVKSLVEKTSLPQAAKLSKFEKPVCKKIVRVGNLTVKIPDGMITLDEYRPTDKTEENQIKELKNVFGLFIFPQNHKGEFKNYPGEAMCINIAKPKKIPQLEVIFQKDALKKLNIEMNIKATLTNVANSFFAQIGISDTSVECVRFGDDFGIFCAQIEKKTNRGAYKFFVFDKSDIYQGNIYINAIGSQNAFSEFAKEWLKSLVIGTAVKENTRPAPNKSDKKYNSGVNSLRQDNAIKRVDKQKEAEKEAERKRILLKEKRKSIGSKIFELQEQYDNKAKTIKADIEDIEKQISEQKSELNSLSGFKFWRKKGLQQTIDALYDTLYEQQRKYNEKKDAVLEDKRINRLKITLNLLDTSVKVGDRIKFGYEPYSNSEFIEWIVIKKDGDTLRLLSSHTITLNAYYGADKWLSEEFIKNCFTPYWKKLIIKKGNALSWLPAYSDIESFMDATPTQSLRQYIINDCTICGRRYGHNDLQIRNSINMCMNSGNSYWIQSTDTTDGFADYIAAGQGRSRIGAASEHGIRAVIEINPLELLNMPELPSFKTSQKNASNFNDTINLSKLIIELLLDGKKYKASDILENIEKSSDYKDVTLQRIAAIMRDLGEKGIVNREDINRLIHYSLAENLIY